MRKVKIKRSKWIRGEELDGWYLPDQVFDRTSILTTQIDGGAARNNDFARDAIDINDEPYITDKQRESELIELFQENNIELTFVD